MWNDPEAGDNRLMHATRVTKTLWPPAAGTAQISGRYAQDLVCVRYRQDANGLWRFTTAEIIIAEGPVNSKAVEKRLFTVQIDYHEAHLRALLKMHGSRWDPDYRWWLTNGATVRKLRLERRAKRAPKNSHR